MVFTKCTTSLLATFWAGHVLVSENLLVLTRCTSMLVVRFLASTSTCAKGRVTGPIDNSQGQGLLFCFFLNYRWDGWGGMKWDEVGMIHD